MVLGVRRSEAPSSLPKAVSRISLGIASDELYLCIETPYVAVRLCDLANDVFTCAHTFDRKFDSSSLRECHVRQVIAPHPHSLSCPQKPHGQFSTEVIPMRARVSPSPQEVRERVQAPPESRAT